MIKILLYDIRWGFFVIYCRCRGNDDGCGGCSFLHCFYNQIQMLKHLSCTRVKFANRCIADWSVLVLPCSLQVCHHIHSGSVVHTRTPHILITYEYCCHRSFQITSSAFICRLSVCAQLMNEHGNERNQHLSCFMVHMSCKNKFTVWKIDLRHL